MTRTVKQRVDEFRRNNPKAGAELMIADMDEIAEMDSTSDIISTAFYFGYMKGQKQLKNRIYEHFSREGE